MAFDWKGFLLKLAEEAPVIVATVATLTTEAKGGASRTQLATDSLNDATGVSQALLSDDPQESQLAVIASGITSSVISATSQAHAAQGLPHLAS